ELLPASVHGGEIEDPVGERLRSRRDLTPWRGEHLVDHRLEIRARARREIGRRRASGVAREDDLSGAPGIVEEGVVELEVGIQETVDLELVPGGLDIETAKESARRELDTDAPVHRCLGMELLLVLIDEGPQARIRCSERAAAKRDAGKRGTAGD